MTKQELVLFKEMHEVCRQYLRIAMDMPLTDEQIAYNHSVIELCNEARDVVDHYEKGDRNAG